jgi:hypothetical protein
MTDTYSVVPGWNDPSLPPVNLPSMDLPPSPRAPVRITVGRTPPPEKPAPGRPAETPPAARPAWEDLPDVETAPRKEEKPATAKPAWEDLPDIADVPPPKKPGPVIGTGEAAGIGALQGLTFGAQPAIAGLTEAAGEPGKRAIEQEQRMLESGIPGSEEFAGYAGVAQPFIGAARMVHDWVKGHPDPSVQESYERGRQAALERRDAAYEQHKMAYMGGMMAGSLMTPTFGAGAPAAAAGRIYQGIRAGGIGGTLYGLGTGVSEGKSGEELLREAPFNALTGGVTGAGGQYVFGARPRTGPGMEAARTAEEVGGALPKGYASPQRWVQHLTGALESLPIVGPRIKGKVERTGERAGERVEEVVGQTGVPVGPTGHPERAATALRTTPGLERAVQNGRQEINDLYGSTRGGATPAAGSLRGRIDADRRMPMPYLHAKLQELRAARYNWPNPGEGLERFENLVSMGGSFNAAHETRAFARSPGGVHPGYDAGWYNEIARAITQDMTRNIANAAHTQTPAGRRAAVLTFMEAEQAFERLRPFNEQLNQLAENGAAGLASILTAAGEKSSDLPLLRHLEQYMPQREFRMLGGQVLGELGQSAGGFSLSQFSNNWRKLSESAKTTLFEPAHKAQIDRIAALGDWLRQVRRDTSTSHSSNWLAYVIGAGELLGMAGEGWALYKEAVEGEGPGAYTAATTAQNVAMLSTAFILGNRARTAAAANWLQAIRALASPTPARTAAFNVATRNLANTMGISERALLQRWHDVSQRHLAEEEPTGTPRAGGLAVPMTKSEARIPAGSP